MRGEKYHIFCEADRIFDNILITELKYPNYFMTWLTAQHGSVLQNCIFFEKLFESVL